jgi:hypothetical protein
MHNNGSYDEFTWVPLLFSGGDQDDSARERKIVCLDLGSDLEIMDRNLWGAPLRGGRRHGRKVT